MRILNRIFKILSWVVIAVILFFVAIAAPIIMGFKPVVVLSGSMEPSYPVGCITYYHSCQFNEIGVGDAVTFQAGDSLVTHRVVKVNGISQNLVTKGDNNPTEDPVPIESADVKGKTIKFKVPLAGYLVTYAKNLYFIATMVSILVISYLLEAYIVRKKGG